MSKKYDPEKLVQDLLKMFRDNLPAKLAAINTEKGDSLLVAPDLEAWFFQNLNDSSFNFEPFVVYSIDAMTIGSNNTAAASKNIVVSFEVAFVDHGENDSDNIYRKLLRFTRALEEIFFEKKRESIPSCVELEIQTLAPLGVDAGGKIIRTGGVSLLASIAD